MRRFWFLFYNLKVVPLMYVAFKLGGIFNSKIKRGIKDRRGWFKSLSKELAKLEEAKPRIWLHVASMGEFEQAKPVMKALKERYPDLYLIVSFFSPSGYEHTGNFPAIDLKCSLPFDSYFNAKKFISLINPQIAAVLRYDIWPNYIWRLNRLRIPTLLLDAALQERSPRLSPLLKGFNRNLYSCFDCLLAISEEDAKRLEEIYPFKEKILLIGDTRCDQVYNRSLERDKVEWLNSNAFFWNKRVFVAGSTWPSDEQHLLPAFERLAKSCEDLVMILVPHEPTPERLDEIEGKLSKISLKAIRLSNLSNGAGGVDCEILLVDEIGMLANLYSLGQVAYVGGSFGPGVHNVLEPAVYGNPVLFGPRMDNSHEAKLLADRGAGFIVKDGEELYERLSYLLGDFKETQRRGQIAREVVMENLGASQKTAERLGKYLIELMSKP